MKIILIELALGLPGRLETHHGIVLFEEQIKLVLEFNYFFIVFMHSALMATLSLVFL